MNKINDSEEIILASTCLLLSIARADDFVDEEEAKIINEILQDFFDITKEEAVSLIAKANIDLDKSTDYFSYGSKLNEHFSLTDKIDFISCIFEVAYSDGDYHYMEEHMIKKIAHMFHIENKDLINVKMDIKRFFS